MGLGMRACSGMSSSLQPHEPHQAPLSTGFSEARLLDNGVFFKGLQVTLHMEPGLRTYSLGGEKWPSETKSTEAC